MIITPQNIDPIVVAVVTLLAILFIVFLRFRRWVDEGYLLELQTKYYEMKLREMREDVIAGQRVRQ